MEYINLLIKKLIIFHKDYIGETIIYPDQFGNYIIFLLFYLFLLPFIFFYRDDYKKIRLIFFLFIGTIFFKTLLFYTSHSSCKKIDTDGYTSYAKWMLSKDFDRIHPQANFNKNLNNKKIIIYKDKIFLSINDKKIIDIKNQILFNFNENKNINNFFIVNDIIYLKNDQNNILEIDKDLKKIKKKYDFKKYEVTHLDTYNENILLSTKNGILLDINHQKIIEVNFPIKKFKIINKKLLLLDYFNKIYVYSFDDKNYIRSIKLSNSNMNFNNSIDFRIFDNKNINKNLTIIEDFFLKFSNKGYEIKYITKNEKDYYALSYDGKVIRFKDFKSIIKLLDESKNIHDLQNKLNYFENNFRYDDIFLNDKFSFGSNVYGDFFIRNLLNNSKYEYFGKTENNEIKLANFQISKDHIRLPGYPLISSFLMKVTKIKNACNIVVFQHLIILVLLISLIIFSHYRKISIIFFILILIMSDPYNYLLTIASMDNPHFFEAIIFSIFLILDFKYKKEKFYKLMKLILILCSALISTKIIVGIVFYYAVKLIYNFIIKKDNVYEHIKTLFLILYTLTIISIVSYQFDGQSKYNKTNLDKQFISYLLIKNSNKFQMDEVNKFKKENDFLIEKEHKYLSSGIDGKQKISSFSNVISGFNVYEKPIINLSNRSLIKENQQNSLSLIFLSLDLLIKDTLKNIFKDLNIFFSISSLQQKYNILYLIGIILFIRGYISSINIIGNHTHIILGSYIILYIFYSSLLGVQARFLSIYFLYIIFLYYLGIKNIFKDINKIFLKKT